MASIAIQIYKIPIDVITYTILLYNFAIVGVIAIFYQNGIPNYITQIYLVCTSVILAWHLSHFDDWTAWTLLVMLAFYDLCAVLTPCGPLKALVNLMSKEDAPDMPGLLYEAHLPAGTQKPGANGNSSSGDGSGNRNRRRRNENGGASSNGESNRPINNRSEGGQESAQRREENTTAVTENTHLQQEQTSLSSKRRTSNIPSTSSSNEPSLVSTTSSGGPHARLPLAIAKIYRLPLVSRYNNGISSSSFSKNRRKKQQSQRNRRKRNRNKNNKRSQQGSSTINESPLLADDPYSMEEEETDVQQEQNEESTEEFYKRNFSVVELLSEVEVELPANGGRVERVDGSHNRFLVFGRDGNVKRELYLNKKGKVYDVTDEEDDDSLYDDDGPASIRLGLVSFTFTLMTNIFIFWA